MGIERELRYDVLLEELREVVLDNGAIAYGRNGNKRHVVLTIMSGDSLRQAVNKLEEANPGWWATETSLMTELWQ